MVGRAVQNPDGGLKLTAGPERLPADHPLARAHWSDKVLWMQTRTQGGQVHHCIGASASDTRKYVFRLGDHCQGTLMNTFSEMQK